MNTMCENFDANHDDTLGADRPFIFACRDRRAMGISLVIK